MTVQQISNGDSDGAQFPNTKLGFFGTTPIAKPSVTWPNTGTATTTLNELKCQRLMTALVNLGIIVTT
jgi:hypothetical protein